MRRPEVPAAGPRYRTADEQAEFTEIRGSHLGDPTWRRYQELAALLPPLVVMVAKAALTRRMIGQMDKAHDRNCQRTDRAVCRVHFEREDHVIIQTPAGCVRITLSNYVNQGWDHAFGAPSTIPKVILP